MSGIRIGLEVHVYVLTDAKLFCACPADFLSAAPNTNICPSCTGQPGAKPYAPNGRALDAGILLARALGCTLEDRTPFMRKHYFYPDLPSNYQRTSEPFARGGTLCGVGIEEIHWEEDPGAYDLHSGTVDYDRAGAPLLELVTKPEITSPEHARRFLQELRLVLRYLGIWREAAGVKADCNVSVHMGERAEVKNVNSVRNVESALAFEIKRQLEAYARGERQTLETRHFEEATGVTVRLRTKETADDYRFLVDPDVRAVDVAAVARGLDTLESPLARRARIAASLSIEDAAVSPLFEERALVDAYETAVGSGNDARRVFEFILRDLRGELETRSVNLANTSLDGPSIAALITALSSGAITPHVATRVLRAALDGARLSDVLDAERKATAAAASLDLDALADGVLDANPKAVADHHGGKQGAIHFLVGALMKQTRGRANIGAARTALEAALARR